MASEKILRLQQASLAVSGVARRRGRIGLTISWENIPWWGLIILLVGVIAGYSALTSTRYRDALSFMLDLPWNKEMLGEVEVGESGEWSFEVERALKPGNYTLYAEFRDENQSVAGRSDVYRIKVPVGAPKLEAEPVTSPAETPILVQTSTPTIVGTATPGVTVVLFDDFSHNPL